MCKRTSDIFLAKNSTCFGACNKEVCFSWTHASSLLQKQPQLSQMKEYIFMWFKNFAYCTLNGLKKSEGLYWRKKLYYCWTVTPKIYFCRKPEENRVSLIKISTWILYWFTMLFSETILIVTVWWRVKACSYFSLDTFGSYLPEGAQQPSRNWPSEGGK